MYHLENFNFLSEKMRIPETGKAHLDVLRRLYVPASSVKTCFADNTEFIAGMLRYVGGTMSEQHTRGNDEEVKVHFLALPTSGNLTRTIDDLQSPNCGVPRDPGCPFLGHSWLPW